LVKITKYPMLGKVLSMLSAFVITCFWESQIIQKYSENPGEIIKNIFENQTKSESYSFNYIKRNSP